MASEGPPAIAAALSHPFRCRDRLEGRRRLNPDRGCAVVRQLPEKTAPTGCAECISTDGLTPFCLVHFVAQKVHFRIGAKRVPEVFDETP